jgi:hypothetical protein
VNNRTPPRLRPGRLGDALAQLQRGLQDGDDPLYDPWKFSKISAPPTTSASPPSDTTTDADSSVRHATPRRSWFSRFPRGVPLSAPARFLLLAALALVALAAGLLVGRWIGFPLSGQ